MGRKSKKLNVIYILETKTKNSHRKHWVKEVELVLKTFEIKTNIQNAYKGYKVGWETTKII